MKTELGFIVLCFCMNVHFVLLQEEFDDEVIPIVEGVQVTEEDDVIVLTDENFNAIVSNKPIILVEFYAPWCGHCQTLAPEYAKAATILKKSIPIIPLAKVDATIQEEIAKKHGVSGFPTLFIFKKGEKIEYDGPRTAEGIVDYMKREADSNYKPPPSAVLTLTDANFSSIVDKKELILVEFYAPWCGHCKRLDPEYERAARALSSLSPSISLAKVDATIEKEVAQKYDVTGYPTLFIFRNGKEFKYTGPREETGIIDYMKEQAKPPSQEITTSKQLDNNINGRTIAVVGFFGSSGDPLFQEYQNAANVQRQKYIFLHTFAKNVVSYASAQEGLIALYQPEIFQSKFEPKRHEFTMKDAVQQDILNFLDLNRVPLVGHRTNENFEIYSKLFPVVVVYYDVDFSFEHKKQTQIIRNHVLNVAKDYVGQITFAIAKEDIFQEELKTLSLEDSGEDVNVGFYKSSNVRYAMEPTDEFSADELRAFVKGVLKGKIKRHIKSTKPPKTNPGPVLTVVGSTFEQIITSGKDGKDVLLEIYAPWCQHCNRFAPTYEKLGKELSSSYGIKVAKIDPTSNDVPAEFPIEGYPTLYYVSHKQSSEDGKPKIIKYDLKSWAYQDVKKFVVEQNDAITSSEGKQEL